ncbi:MAG: FlgD immunoglobulin-like domain containing protein, partial [Candidatus Zixiibacteriota bacterium]
EATPILLANDMEMNYAYNADENVTRVLVYSFEGNGFSGEFLNANGDVVSLELGSYEGAVVKATEVPADYALNQNYPNPFNPTTEIGFTLPTALEVKLEVFNLLGQRVKTLVDGRLDAGAHTVSWNATDDAGRPVSSGVYFYRIQAGDFIEAKKMMLLK